MLITDLLESPGESDGLRQLVWTIRCLWASLDRADALTAGSLTDHQGLVLVVILGLAGDVDLPRRLGFAPCARRFLVRLPRSVGVSIFGGCHLRDVLPGVLRGARELAECFGVQLVRTFDHFGEFSYIGLLLVRWVAPSRLRFLLRIQQLVLADDRAAGADEVRVGAVGHSEAVFDLNDCSVVDHGVHFVNQAPDAALALEV